MSTKDKYIYGPKVPVGPIPGSNFGHFLIEKMKGNGSKVYQIDAVTEEQWTYSETVDYAIRVALELQSRGIGPGKILSVVGSHSMQIILPIYAGLLVGATSNPIHPTIEEYDLEITFTFAKPDIIFCDEKCRSTIEKVLCKLNIDAIVVSFERDFSEFVDEKHQPKVAGFKAVPVKPTHNGMILCTSGTTGNTKGVPLTHGALHGALIAGMTIMPALNETPVILTYSPMSWITAPLFHFVSVMLAGRKIVANFDPDKHLQITDKYSVNWTMANPNFITELIHLPDFSKSNMKNLMKSVQFGGSAASNRQIDEFFSTFPNAIVQNSLGSTEFCGIHIVFSGATQVDLMKKYPYSLGFIAPNNIGKLIDESTDEIITEPNRPGELYLKGPTMFTGYLNRPELNKDIFDSDGFYKTGDIFIRDENGIFTFVGRAKDTFKYLHHKIDPLEIENVIVKHPAVSFTCVMGRPDPFNVELPMAFVIKNPGFESTSKEDIVQFVEDKVKEYQRLRGGVIFLDQFPMTTSGKIRKVELRKLIL